jgi:hypothetical protein
LTATQTAEAADKRLEAAIAATRACGNCSKFSDEDTEGWGICSHFDNGTHVARSCRYWKARGKS